MLGIKKAWSEDQIYPKRVSVQIDHGYKPLDQFNDPIQSIHVWVRNRATKVNEKFRYYVNETCGVELRFSHMVAYPAGVGTQGA